VQPQRPDRRRRQQALELLDALGGFFQVGRQRLDIGVVQPGPDQERAGAQAVGCRSARCQTPFRLRTPTPLKMRQASVKVGNLPVSLGSVLGAVWGSDSAPNHDLTNLAGPISL
jgi:hypothetical protein